MAYDENVGRAQQERRAKESNMAQRLTRRGFVRLAGGVLGTALLSACSGNQGGDGQGAAGQDAAAQDGTSKDAAASSGIDYMVLVNWQNKLPDDWEANVELVEEKSLLYDSPVRVERKAYEAWKGLKEDLAKEGTNVELDSCYRSVVDQQEVWDEFIKKYGEEYTKTHVAVPGYSEHHTGLALDLFLVIDGKQVYENEEMVKHTDVWEKIHAKLADHGFILRYLPQRDIFTHCSYEPWHIRYIDDPEAATKITAAGQTFEEYLDKVNPPVAGCTVDYGDSKLYDDSTIDSALNVMLDEFCTWKGCVMQRFAFAGDDACGAEEVKYVNSLRKEGTDEFEQAIVLVTDFHSPSAEQAEGTAWEPDTDYKDYAWHLGRANADSGWQLMGWGYA
jgi:D-alanyl-D-alanine carboxypeptidase